MRTLAFLLALALGAAAQAAPVADPVYTELRNARPDGRRVPVQGLALERDVFQLRFDSGAFHFLAPVQGRTVGAVFIGQGSLRLVPATPAESRQLALAAGGDKTFESLTEEFDELVLLFADDTAAEIQLHAPSRPARPTRRRSRPGRRTSSGSARTSRPTSTSASCRTSSTPPA